MTHERIKVDVSEIKVGDLIEVEHTSAKGGFQTYRDVVVGVYSDSVNTRDFTFYGQYNKDRTFYRLPTPAPNEPKGLGAVVELHDGDGEPWLIVRVGSEEWQDSQGDIMTWSNWLNYSAYAKVLSEGYNA